MGTHTKTKTAAGQAKICKPCLPAQSPETEIEVSQNRVQGQNPRQRDHAASATRTASCCGKVNTGKRHRSAATTTNVGAVGWYWPEATVLGGAGLFPAGAGTGPIHPVAGPVKKKLTASVCRSNDPVVEAA